MFNDIMAYACFTFSLANAVAQQVLPEIAEALPAMEGDFPARGLVWLCLAIGLASTLVAGVFQAFSDFVMRGLGQAEPMGGAQSMQMINRTVMRSVFLALLLGLVPVTLAVSLYAQLAMDGAARGWIQAGAAIYVATVFLVTMVGNVPMNNRLDRMTPTEPETARYWDHYGRVWTRWNHVRTLGSFAAGVCFILAALALA